MNSRTEVVRDGQNCIEVATIVHEGHEFTAGGSAVWTDERGKLRGILYAPGTPPYTNGQGSQHNIKELTSWDGKVKVPCQLESVWESGFMDYHGRRQVNQSFFFTIYGRKCRGVNYNREWSQVVRFKEI